MKSLLLLGLIFFALSFCGLTDKLKSLSGGTNSSNSNMTSSNSSFTSTGAEKGEIDTGSAGDCRRRDGNEMG